MNFIDRKYVNLLSGRLDRFTVKKLRPYQVNCRCPICGDSQKSKSKARGWLLEKDANLTVFYCHNCNASMSLKNFLKEVDVTLAQEYEKEIYFEKYKDKKERELKPISSPMDFTVKKFQRKSSYLKDLRKISTLNPDHSVKKYIVSRKIPANKHYKLFYAPKFVEWVNSILPNKLDMKEHRRLILPFIDKEGKMFGFQGRAFVDNQPRYITIMIDETMPKVFGLDSVDFTMPYYIFEGPIDSLFFDNSIAMAGASFDSNVLKNPENAIIVYDNEPRNLNIINAMHGSIKDGKKVCFWPNTIEEKDVNDMVLAGYNQIALDGFITENSYSGLMAEAKLSNWRKV